MDREEKGEERGKKFLEGGKKRTSDRVAVKAGHLGV